jgi:hypothetical protein
MNGEIEVLYKCKCMKDQAAVMVPERLPGEDLGHWMDHSFGMSLYLDHHRRSPTCRETVMEFAKIPHHEAATQVGTKPVLS